VAFCKTLSIYKGQGKRRSVSHQRCNERWKLKYSILWTAPGRRVAP
jgi:hypothetical protein